MRRQGTIKRYNTRRPYFITQFPNLISNFTTSSLNLFLPRQKQQNIALTLILMDGDGSLDGCLDVISLWFFAEVDVDVVHSTWNVEPWGVLEVLLEAKGVHGGGHDD